MECKVTLTAGEIDLLDSYLCTKQEKLVKTGKGDSKVYHKIEKIRQKLHDSYYGSYAKKYHPETV